MLRRSTLVWLAIRGALFVLHGVEPLSVRAVVLIVTLPVVLVLFDLRRSGEKLFLANLGIPTWSLGALAAMPPLVLELVLDRVVL